MKVKYPDTQPISRLFNIENPKSSQLGVSVEDTPSLPAFGSWPPADHQRIGQFLGHVPSLAMMELPMGLKLLAWLKPNVHVFARSLTIGITWISRCDILHAFPEFCHEKNPSSCLECTYEELCLQQWGA